MMRIASTAVLLLLSCDAHRVQVDIHDTVESKSDTQFFTSCDGLQTTFRSRVANIQAMQEAHADSTTMSATTRARYTMRAFGVVRILRRARHCPWVVDGDSEDIQHVHSVVHAALEGNPCGDAALVALSAPAPAENQLEPLQQAVQILYSDNCEVPAEGTDQTQVIDLDEDDAAVSQRLVEGEQQAQDVIDDMMDAAATESESRAPGSFVQTEGIVLRVSRMLGVVFLSILYLLSCAAAGVLIGLLIGFVLMVFPCSMLIQGPSAMACFNLPVLGVMLGVASGTVSCGIDLAYAQGNFSQLGRGAF